MPLVYHKCLAYLLIFQAVFWGASPASAQDAILSALCRNVVKEENANAIIREVFVEKATRLRNEGWLSDAFWKENEKLSFVICDTGYDTTLLHGRGVAFDLPMITFLFAQSRALRIGRAVSLSQQFVVHRDIVSHFIDQGESLKAGPMALIENKVISLGKTKQFLDATYSDPEYSKSEQTIFLVALYFLSMHERCHASQRHDIRREEIMKSPEAGRARAVQQLELDADACALEIINSDEGRHKGSPISFQASIMTIATQAIVANHPALRSARSHPHVRERLRHAKEITMKFLGSAPIEGPRENYTATVQATYDYFDGLLSEYEAKQK